MKLRTQIVAFGLAGALLAGVVGGIGLVATAGLGVAIDDSILAGQALQASQEADMMHDAIRGDAQLALLGALQKDPQRLTEAEKGLTAHAQTFQKALAQLHALPLSKPTCVGLDRPRSGRVSRPCGLQGSPARGGPARAKGPGSGTASPRRGFCSVPRPDAGAGQAAAQFSTLGHGQRGIDGAIGCIRA